MPDEKDGQEPTGNPDGQPPPPPPLEPTIEQRIMTLESKSHAHAAQDDSAKEMKREFRLVEIFTIATNVILAIVGIFALCAYYGQLRAMQGQLAQMSRDAQSSSAQFQVQLKHFDAGLGRSDDLAKHAGEQADASRKLADAAKIQAELSKNALLTGQRAFVLATGFDVIRMPNPANDNEIASIEISMVWENTGSTPTKNLRSHFNYLPHLGPFPQDFQYPDLGSDEPTPADVGPKGVAHTVPFSIPASDVREIVAHRKILSVWGWARYNDVFPRTKGHVTRFCTELTGFQGDPLNPSPYAVVRPLIQNCKSAVSNCYDDECKVQ
jgi:hypothetical protein